VSFGANPPDEQLDLRVALLDAGVDPAEVDRAQAEDKLELLALERFFAAGDLIYDVDEVSRLSGVEVDQIRTFWRALGFPDPNPGERLLSPADVELLATVLPYIDEGILEPELALQMARVIGSAMDRVATAQIDAVELRRDRGELHPEGLLPSSARSTTDLLELMPRIMELVWRRQLAGAARRRLMRAGVDAERLLVGFADLVGFTARTAQLDEQELAEVVGRFESTAFDVVAEHEGRVVKMIGDEVMFLHDDVRGGGALALDLAERFRDDPDLSDVRVGLACGPVLERDGDVYGQVVNLASRIVSVAYPGSVVVSQDVHDALADDPQLYLRSLRSHYLKDIGKVPLWTLRRAADEHEQSYRRARERMAAREFLRDRWEQLRHDTVVLPEVLPPALRRELAAHQRSEDDDEQHSTGQYAALAEAVLEADLDPGAQVEILADLEAERRLRKLEHEAQEKATEADREAERRLEEIEREARRRVEEVEREARRRVEQILEEAEERSRQVNDEASRKVKRVAEEVERKADRATKQAKVDAERKTKQAARARNGRRRREAKRDTDDGADDGEER